MRHRYFRIRDMFDEQEICIVKTSLTKKELEEKIREQVDRDFLTYNELLERLGLEVIEIEDEVYI